MKGKKKTRSKRETDAIGSVMPGKVGKAAKATMKRRSSDRMKSVMGEIRKTRKNTK